MTDVNLPPLPRGDVYVRGSATGQPMWAFSEEQMRAYAAQAVIAERERCARLCERVINESAMGRGHAKGAALCIGLIKGKA